MARRVPPQWYGGAVCAGTAGRGRGADYPIGNGADVLMERALTRSLGERATLRKTMGKPPVDEDIPAEEQVCIPCVNCSDCGIWRSGEEGTFLLPHKFAGYKRAAPRIVIRSGGFSSPTPFVAPLPERRYRQIL